jgi:diguanylate cyclase (GGDEF)-like protein
MALDTRQGTPATRTSRRASERVASAADFQDVLVFEHHDSGFSLRGGRGRGAGWAGIVELGARDEALVGRAWRRGTGERVEVRRAVQIAGPYYARHAVAIPVGHRHVVVLGSDKPIAAGDTQLVMLAAAEVDAIDGVSASKLLADELELVHAIRALMAYRPMTVADTVRHIATVAGQALSCEVAVVRIELGNAALVEGLDLRSGSALEHPDADGHLASVRSDGQPVVEQVAPDDPDVFGVEVASRLTLPIAGGSLGALALGHAVSRPRGFTSLCQRIGRAIADAAELLIGQAQAREELARERDLLARMSLTDALTGISNRRAWDEQVEAWAQAGRHDAAVVLYCDLDGLKRVNDRYGHAAGDALIRGAANLLRSTVRESDFVARVGGDEFVVLIQTENTAEAQRIGRRIRRAERAWRVTEHSLTPCLSIGASRVVDGDLDAARVEADRLMYVDKRRRRRRDAELRPRERRARPAAS